MKTLRLFSFVFLLLAFAACSNDDEPSGPISKELVGNWYDGDNYLISLKGNGKYKAYEYPDLDKGTYEDYWNGTWTYDSETGHLVMYWENTHDIEDEFTITEITENYFAVGKERFNRIPDSKLPTKYIRD